MANPAPYSGLAEECKGFLFQCSPTLEVQPQRWGAKIAFVISLLTARALAAILTHSLKSFVTHFHEVFRQAASRCTMTPSDWGSSFNWPFKSPIVCEGQHSSLQRQPEQASSPEREPMLIESTQLPMAERRWQQTQGLCLYCGSAWHAITLPSAHLQKTIKERSYQAQSISGKPLNRSTIKYRVGPIQLQVDHLHRKQIHLLVLNNSTTGIILGRL